LTLLRLDELAQLNTLDQILLWSIVSINAANLDSRNTFISDNAGVRAESKDYIQWSVSQDDKGLGRFVFTALLPVVNPQPLQDKASLLERIWSYSPYEPRQNFDAGILGYGTGIPALPPWVDTCERLLAYVAILATFISKYARRTKGDAAFWEAIHPEYWADIQYKLLDSAYGGNMTITGSMYIDWNSYLQGLSLIKCLNPDPARASDLSCNFPILSLLWGVPDVDPALPPSAIEPLIPSVGEFSVQGAGISSNTESSAGALISSYDQSFFNDDALPEWYFNAVNGIPGGGGAPTDIAQISGTATPQLIESLGICKEQDPSIISYANELGTTLPKK
jgi:hypothetical protein